MFVKRKNAKIAAAFGAALAASSGAAHAQAVRSDHAKDITERRGNVTEQGIRNIERVCRALFDRKLGKVKEGTHRRVWGNVGSDGTTVIVDRCRLEP